MPQNLEKFLLSRLIKDTPAFKSCRCWLRHVIEGCVGIEMIGVSIARKYVQLGNSLNIEKYLFVFHKQKTIGDNFH